MSENSVMLSVSEYDRLRALDVRITLLQAELCAARAELAERYRELHPLTTRMSEPLVGLSVLRHYTEPVTFLAGPVVRGVVCANCKADMWLMDGNNDPLCGSCGLYVENGIKIVSVNPTPIESQLWLGNQRTQID